MLARLLIAFFGITITLCQAAYKSEQPYPEKFKYWGCATVDAAGFSNPVPLPNGVLTPEMCQAACADHMFAAVSPTACRCGDDPNAIKSINEGFCNNPCSEDPNSPMCGGGCSEGDSDISNLFVVQPAIIQATETQPEPGNPGNQPAPFTTVITISTSVVSFASAALPWQTSSVGQDQVPPSSPAIVQQPSDVASPLPSSAFVPIDPTTTSPGELLESASISTTQTPSSLTWAEDEPPTTPVADPDSLSDGSEVMSKFQAETPNSETILTDTGSVPFPSPTVTQVGISKANQFEIPLVVTLGELLIIAMILV
ncbi:twf1- an actin monomer sequestering [Fusarium sporotrichioides]|uniref:Twf1-an actin monomer sequestering n=1 Tax=Fusarium sporotrichioides TaxID=5514 RepID=A0A395SGK0_FUSSP|nr:twf1- an actin monomer sequestering [Fusarium sporotrichioides]